MQERKRGRMMTTSGVSVEIEGKQRPALVGDRESLWITPPQKGPSA